MGDPRHGTTPPAAAATPIDGLLGHAGWVRALARELARDEHAAEDLVQQTWLRAIERRGASAPRGPGWLATVVRNLARDAGRRDRRRSAREAASARRDETAPAADLVARAEAQKRILRAVLELPEPARTVVLLRFYEGLAPREIAARTAVPSATVRTRLHRALAELRARLGPDAALVAVPLTALPPLAALPPANVIGGLAVTSKQKAALALVLALLFGGATLWALEDGPKPAPAQETSDGGAAATAAPRERARPEAPPAAADASAPVTPPTAASASGETSPARRRLAVEVLRALPPTEPPPGVPELDPDAKVPIPLPEDGDEVELGGAGGAMGIVGWSRWHPVAPKGTVTWRGRVIDADGAPVAGADLLRVELDASGARASPCSYQWIAGAAKTGADGTFEAREQPEGAFLLAADFHSRMTGAQGLDLAASRRVSGAKGETLSSLEVRLPFSVARLATLRAVVLDDEGKPLRSASVSCGLQGGITDAEGRYTLAGIDAGAAAVSFGAQGYATRRERFELRAGETRDVEIRLDLAEKGALDLEGRVVDDAGSPVAGMGVYLVATDTGSRWAHTDAQGVFRFRKLPDAWASRELQLVASPMPEEDPYLGADVKIDRVPSPGLEIRVQRTAPVTILVRGAAAGGVAGLPIPLFNLILKREGESEDGTGLQVFRAGSFHEETGSTTMDLPVGRVVVEVEGKGHRGLEVAFVVPAAAEPVEVLLELPPE